MSVTTAETPADEAAETKPSPDAIVNYLTALYPPSEKLSGEIILVRNKLERVGIYKPHQLTAVVFEIQKNPSNLFVKYNLIDSEEMIERNPHGIGGAKEVSTILALGLDCDAGKEQYRSQDDVLERLYDMPLAPSMIVLSNQTNAGLHAYWLLQPHIVPKVDGQRNHERYKHVSERWRLLLLEKFGYGEEQFKQWKQAAKVAEDAKRLKSDAHNVLKLEAKKLGPPVDSTHNIDRLLRPVGSLRSSGNYCRFLAFQPERRYSFEEVEALLPAPKPRVQNKSFHRDGQRSNKELVRSLLDKKGVEYTEDEEGFLMHCLFEDGHSTPNGPRDLKIYANDGHPITVNCTHTSCEGRTWHDVAEHCDPGYAEEQERKRQEWDERQKTVDQNKNGSGNTTGTDQVDSLVYREADIGTHYSPADRDNWGECIGQTRTTITLRLVGQGGVAEKAFHKSEVKDKDLQLLAEAERPKINVITSQELDEATFKREFLIKQVLVENQPCVIGGKSKTLKTSILVDAALSIGTGTPFLGQFDVPRRSNVVVLTGESGEATVQETARRVAKQKDVRLADASVNWGFELPQLSSDSSLERLQEMIEDTKSEVCCVDPAYLCLLEAGQGSSANNMFEVGPLLKRFVEVGKRAGCTMLLCHHLRKWNQSGNEHGVPELEDLAYGGFAQFFRQWMLLGRRASYMGDGEHKLWLAVGGSAGHGGQYGVDVQEGCLQDDFTGRVWDPTVVSGAEQRQRQQDEKEQAKARKQEEQEGHYTRKLRNELALHASGETKSELRTLAGLNDSAFRVAIRNLLKSGEAESCKVQKKNNREYDGFKPTVNLTALRQSDSVRLTQTGEDQSG